MPPHHRHQSGPPHRANPRFIFYHHVDMLGCWLPCPCPRLSLPLSPSLCVCVCTLPNEEFKSSLCLCIVCNVMYPAVYIGPSPPYCRLLSRNAHHLNSQRPIHSPSSSFVEKEIFHFSNFLLGFYVWLKYKKFPQNI